MQKLISAVVAALCVAAPLGPALADGSAGGGNRAMAPVLLRPLVIERVYRNDPSPCQMDLDFFNPIQDPKRPLPSDCVKDVNDGSVILLISKAGETKSARVAVLAVPRATALAQTSSSMANSSISRTQSAAALPNARSVAATSVPTVDPRIVWSGAWKENVIQAKTAGTPVPNRSYVYAPHANASQCFIVRLISGGASVDSKPVC